MRKMVKIGDCLDEGLTKLGLKRVMEREGVEAAWKVVGEAYPGVAVADFFEGTLVLSARSGARRFNVLARSEAIVRAMNALLAREAVKKLRVRLARRERDVSEGEER